MCGPSEAEARAALRAIFDAAVASAKPETVIASHLPEKPKGRCIVVGAGKASAAMAAGLEAAWPDVPMSGLIVTRYDHAVPTQRLEVVEAAHPVPDVAGLQAAARILKLVEGLTPDDLVIALISGGGSALLTAPAEGLTLADKQGVNRALLKSGATITEMNTVRKHLSRIKGGRLLAAAHPARVVTLVISDVPGDDPAIIASGPTVPDATTPDDARAILARYGINLSSAVATALSRGSFVAPRDAIMDLHMIASPAMALAAAAEEARARGLTPLLLGDALEGEAREVGIVMAGVARSVALHGQPLGAPAVLLSGGECTVTIGSGAAGRGGRNTEFLLGFAVAAAGEERLYAVAGDSDGIDGTEDAAGAIVTPQTLVRGKALGLDARAFLAGHDSYSYFDALGDLIRTGPTFTNVNDIRAILIA